MHESSASLRISGPVDLVGGIPYLLGFQPEESLILVGLAHGALVVTARLDLPDASQDLAGLDDTVEAMLRGGCTDFIAAVYTGHDMDLHRLLVDDIIAVMADREALLLDALYVADGLWRSYLCQDPTCCAPGARALPVAPTPFQVAATVAGLSYAPDRQSLADQFNPMSGRESLLGRLRHAEQLSIEPLLHGSLTPPARALVDELTSALEESSCRGYRPVSEEKLIDWATALRHIPIRDELWHAVDQRRGEGAELWLDLARRLPAPYDAAPLFLYGWSMWRVGNGALARIAAERCLVSCPTSTAARLLLTGVDLAVNPHAIPIIDTTPAIS